jgi:hypothetical protein
MEGSMDGWRHRRKEGRKEGRMEAWKEAWKEGRKEGRKELTDIKLSRRRRGGLHLERKEGRKD